VNVDALEQSLLTFGTLNDRVEVVLFLAPNRALPSKVGFKAPQTSDDLKQRGFDGYFTVVGDHTQRAMKQLHSRFKNNPKWATLNATVYVCQRTPDVYSSLKSWGLLDNIKGEARVAVSFADKISSLHDDYVMLSLHEATPGHKERTASLKLRRAKDFGDVSTGQIGQLWSLAARTGKVWDHLWAIISGRVTPPAQSKLKPTSKGHKQRAPRLKVVKSAAMFTNIGGVDDQTLAVILGQVPQLHPQHTALGRGRRVRGTRRIVDVRAWAVGTELVFKHAVEHEELFAPAVHVWAEAAARCIAKDGRGARLLAAVALQHASLNAGHGGVLPRHDTTIDHGAAFEISVDGECLHGTNLLVGRHCGGGGLVPGVGKTRGPCV
jgi:hypothetical protein